MDKEFNYDEWSKNYHNKRYIEEVRNLDKKYIEIARKLGITIEDKLYTEYELESLDMDLMSYYKDDDMTEEELKETKSLDNTGVTAEEYKELLEEVGKIVRKYI